MARVPSRLTVVYSSQSLHDPGEIWDWNAEEYGVQHADNYVSFLRRQTFKLASSTNPGRQIESADHFRYHVIKRRSRGYGHVVVLDWSRKLIRSEVFAHVTGLGNKTRSDVTLSLPDRCGSF